MIDNHAPAWLIFAVGFIATACVIVVTLAL